MPTTPSNDQWINLHFLVPCASWNQHEGERAFTSFCWFRPKDMEMKTTLVLIRRLLKEMHYKVLKIEYTLDSDLDYRHYVIDTNIPKDKWEVGSKIFNDYVKDNVSEYEVCSDSEEEDNDTNVSEDPSV